MLVRDKLAGLFVCAGTAGRWKCRRFSASNTINFRFLHLTDDCAPFRCLPFFKNWNNEVVEKRRNVARIPDFEEKGIEKMIEIEYKLKCVRGKLNR
ncbi:unnamed protein product [Bursaphelenchus xylophilus]|uniref:(pine wood nematode) hypothetical protein n=1 Tax=Bursaphelenchus xylophilus TaxID=6326 RepID=A0A1I7SCQ0_BURXY|nr:unnamed protein product [Bursaphelenchus xylophilus]CAG9093708.1 unnamed protein product [Bursaphelenchus xylophilus]